MINPDNKIIDRILEIFRKNDGFILFNHKNPDGDAIGSQIALYRILKKAGKKVYMFSAEEISPNFYFLPCVDEIRTSLPDDSSYDTAVMLDSAKPDRISNREEVDVGKYKVIINIDHHVSNTGYGTLNWVTPKASSTGELVYLLVKKAKYEIDPDIATCLYTAIFADTGGFRHSNTSSKTLKYASELVAAGAQPSGISRSVFACFPERRFLLLGKSLGTLKTVLNGKAAIMWVYADFYSESGSTAADADEFVEYPRSVKGVQIACLFKEIIANNSARVNFRSNSSLHDVNKIASKFGGGGHAEAAACDIEGDREEVEKRVLDAVTEELMRKNIS